ncbi:uncharacterized protein LOC142832925 [Microtus pennsylvanicus]|uniref:uncharacterized protein LOC142832925 n=1 Tax=Microtus pennsylvanicus TaxID=10058 RepID=UPI003F6D3A53
MRLVYCCGDGGGAVNKYKVIAKREETPEENRKGEAVSTIINQKASKTLLYSESTDRCTSTGAKAAALLGSGQRVPTARWRRGPGAGSLRPGRCGRGALCFPRGAAACLPRASGGPRGGQRGPHRLAPPTSQLQPGPPQLPVPPSLPGPKKRPCFAFRERGEGLTRPRLPGAFFRAPRHREGDPRPPSPEPEGTKEAPQASGRERASPRGRGTRAAPPARPGTHFSKGSRRGASTGGLGSPSLRSAVGRHTRDEPRGDWCCVAEVTALSLGGGGGRRSTWLRGSHCGGRETPPHAAAHPPSRGGLLRAAGSGEAALPGSDGERQCVPAPHARGCVFYPPRPQLLASPAPRRTGESAVAAAGKGCGPAALAHSTTRPGPRRPRSRGSFVLQARRDWELFKLLKVTQARVHYQYYVMYKYVLRG